MLSFGDFKKDEITELISNKDPLGLNSDKEIYTTIKSKEAILPEEDNKHGVSMMQFCIISRL